MSDMVARKEDRYVSLLRKNSDDNDDGGSGDNSDGSDNSDNNNISTIKLLFLNIFSVSTHLHCVTSLFL